MSARILHILERIECILGKIVDKSGSFAAWCGLAMVLIVAGNVLARYILNIGSVAIQELEWHLISPIALIGMSYAMRKGEHVRVDFVYDRLNDTAKKGIDLLTTCLLGTTAVVIFLLSLPYVEQSFSMLEGSPDPGGLPYRWVLKAFISYGFGLLALQSIAQLLETAISIGRKFSTASEHCNCLDTQNSELSLRTAG